MKICIIVIPIPNEESLSTNIDTRVRELASELRCFTPHGV